MNKKRWRRRPWQLIQCDRDRFRNLKAFCSRGCAGRPPVSLSVVIPTGWRGEEDGSILNSGGTGSSSNTRQQVTENQDFCHSIPRRFLPLPLPLPPPPFAGAAAGVSVPMSIARARRSAAPARLPTPQSHRVTPAGSLARAALGCARR